MTFPPGWFASSGHGYAASGDVFTASKNANAAGEDVNACSGDRLASSCVQMKQALLLFSILRLVKHHLEITGHFELSYESPVLVCDVGCKLHALCFQIRNGLLDVITIERDMRGAR